MEKFKRRICLDTLAIQGRFPSLKNNFSSYIIIKFHVFSNLGSYYKSSYLDSSKSTGSSTYSSSYSYPDYESKYGAGNSRSGKLMINMERKYNHSIITS